MACIGGCKRGLQIGREVLDYQLHAVDDQAAGHVCRLSLLVIMPSECICVASDWALHTCVGGVQQAVQLELGVDVGRAAGTSRQTFSKHHL